MKAFLLAVVFCGLSFGELRADEPSFIIVTVETVWDNGDLVSPVGEIEQVWSVTPAAYVVVAASNRKSYLIPKSNARLITVAEAALALLAQRDRLYAELHQTEDELDAALAKTKDAKPARPTQYNGRPLPPNWIDPKQADANFNAQQLQNALRQQTQQIQQLQQQLQNQRR